MCSLFPFCFIGLGPKSCSSSWLGQNMDAYSCTYSLLGKGLQPISHSSSNSFPSSLKLSLSPTGAFITLLESLQTGQPPFPELITSKNIPLKSSMCVTATLLTCPFLRRVHLRISLSLTRNFFIICGRLCNRHWWTLNTSNILPVLKKKK